MHVDMDQSTLQWWSRDRKTMVAEVIANTLGLDMFRVDTSSVVSRWVGEGKEPSRNF